MSDDREDIYCRICGSYKLNKLHYALDLGNKIGLYQVLRRDGAIDQLIRPCECRGEFAFAHKICLENWIETTKHEFCDVCSYRYNITYTTQSIYDWIFETHQVSRSLRLLSIAILIYYLGSLGILVHDRRTTRNVLDVIVYSSSYVWMSVCTVYLAVYFYNCISNYRVWSQTNRRVTVEANKEPQLDIQPKPKDVLKSSGFKPKPRETAATITP